jgi:archaemetzincin
MIIFTPPNRTKRRRALGSVPTTKQKIYEEGDNFFHPITALDESSWLTNHKTGEQSVELYSRCKFNPIQKQKRNKIYLWMIKSRVQNTNTPDLNIIVEYLTAFYYPTPVKILECDKELKVTSRMHQGHRQLLVPDILDALQKIIPQDAYCLIGVTMVDLYPRDEWNFVFGTARLKDRVGVFSFARYQASFYDEHEKEDPNMLLYRSCRVCSHEIGHTFSITHCVYYNCLMNGSNSLEESDQRCCQLCPVCLKKLQLCIGFDEIERCEHLLEFYSKYENIFAKEKAWIQRRLAFVKQ